MSFKLLLGVAAFCAIYMGVGLVILDGGIAGLFTTPN